MTPSEAIFKGLALDEDCLGFGGLGFLGLEVQGLGFRASLSVLRSFNLDSQWESFKLLGLYTLGLS